MTNESNNSLARRAFLRRSGHLALAGAGAPLALSLSTMSEAAALNATDSKALVCIFLNGGNDHNNTVCPYDTVNYDRYARIRGGGAGRSAGGIALARSALAATALSPRAGSPALTDDLNYALHPSLGGMKTLFDEGRAAVLLNIGPLVKPTTKAEYLSGDRTAYPLPPRLFSHNDQQSVWQSNAAEGSTRGWGGRLGDLALSSNSANSVFTCISLTGNAVFLSGDTALPYNVSSNGAIALNAAASNVYGSGQVRDALRALVQQTSSHVLENEYAVVTRRSIQSQGILSGALAGSTVNTVFPAGALAAQLKMVARIVGARNTLGIKRQVFFVSLGGFDHHDNLISQHGNLLGQVGDGVLAFQRALQELGVADKVTTFTASDFGRTLTSNGDGSDHGWGSHHFVVGGAVRGQRFYGTAPPVELDGNSDVGQGRLLPSTSVAQLTSTLAQWFGVSASDMPLVVPNINRFGGAAYPTNLGFLDVGP